MRIAFTALILLLAGCATPVAPREYQDEKTAVTITAVAKPWIFTTDNLKSPLNSRDFLSIHALDINHIGSHRQYLAVMQSLYDVSAAADAAAPTLELATPERTFSLQATTETASQLGVTQPLEEGFATQSRWWYYPVSKEDLAGIARSKNVQVALLTHGTRASYVVFRDGSAELSELSATLR